MERFDTSLVAKTTSRQSSTSTATLSTSVIERLIGLLSFKSLGPVYSTQSFRRLLGEKKQRVLARSSGPKNTMNERCKSLQRLAQLGFILNRTSRTIFGSLVTSSPVPLLEKRPSHLQLSERPLTVQDAGQDCKDEVLLQRPGDGRRGPLLAVAVSPRTLELQLLGSQETVGLRTLRALFTKGPILECAYKL